MSDLLAALEAALQGGVSEAFKAAEANSGSIYDLPPDGEYQALIDGFEFLEYKNNSGIGLKVQYRITNHPIYSGRICGDLMTIVSFEEVNGERVMNTDRLPWLKGWLAKMGVNVQELDVVTELRPGGATLEALCDTPVGIKIKRTESRDGSGRKFENVYLQQPLGAWGSGATGATDTGGFMPHSDVPGAESFDFGAVGVGKQSGPADDDIPF